MTSTESPQPAQQDLGLHRPGTVGHLLDQAMKRNLEPHEKGRLLERLFASIARQDRSLGVASIEGYTHWAQRRRESGEDVGASAVDRGIDLVAEAVRSEDGPIAVQCKMHSKRLTKTDLNSFLYEINREGPGGRPRFRQGWLVTTSPVEERTLKGEIAESPVQVKVFHMSRWNTMPVQGAGEVAALSRKSSRDHQKDAIEAVCEQLPGSRRGRLIMACGTGKTFTSLRIAERLARNAGTRRILVGVPAIALAAQFREEWMREAQLPMDVLVVCSDPKAGGQGRRRSEAEKDRLSEELAAWLEMPSRVAGSVEEIRGFLKADPPTSGGLQVVISTYQSLDKVAEAQKDPSIPNFTLAIADEAHQTAVPVLSRRKKPQKEPQFRLFHNKDRIRAGMRLYMTATPRILKESVKARMASKGIPQAELDMGDAVTFGPLLHSYGFAQAVREKNLCDFRVIALGVRPEAIGKVVAQRLQESFTQGGDLLREEAARAMGAMLALRGNARAGDGESETGILHRALAFANSIKRSEGYCKLFSDEAMSRRVRKAERDAGRSAPDGGLGFDAKHLDASSNVALRREELAKLNAAQSQRKVRILSNVGLFGEGVDVPSLEAVVFLDPRSSPVQVVQAVGRAMRLAEDKSMGYVIVPIAVPEGATLREMSERGDERFRPLLEVVRALQTHDETLAEALRSKLYIQEIGAKDEKNGKAIEPDPGDPHGRDGTGNNEDDDQLKMKLDEESLQAIYAQVARRSGVERGVRARATADIIKDRTVAAANRILEAEELTVDLAKMLGLPWSDPKHGTSAKKEAATLGALLLLNAMLVHRRLHVSGAEVPGVEPLRRCMTVKAGTERPGEQQAVALDLAWMRILERDYKPIFEPAIKALGLLKAWPGVCGDVLVQLADCATEQGPRIQEMGWDHAGPLYHKVLHTAKSSGAFYTSNVGALMLAGLAIDDRMADWSDPKDIARLRVMDPACGTGTLLLAILHSLKQRARKANPEMNKEQEEALHRKLVEDSICGLDVNPQAVQLAAANLTMSSTKVDYDRMNLYVMALSGKAGEDAKVGSLELLATEADWEKHRVIRGGGQKDLLHRKRALGGDGVEIERGVEEREGAATHGLGFPVEGLDLVVMNPPFTAKSKRYTALPQDERDRLFSREEDIAWICENREPALGDVIDGNGVRTYFGPLAEVLADREKGRLAMVLPTTALTGAMGAPERRWLAEHFHVERIISNHDPKNFSFSENTAIHEVLIVCRRKGEGEVKPTSSLSLRKRPMNEAEASGFLEAALSSQGAPEWFTRSQIPAKKIENGDWSFVQWHQPEITEIIEKLETSPRLIKLKEVATLGPTAQQAIGTWRKCEDDEIPETHAFWSKSSKTNLSIRGAPETPVIRKRKTSKIWTEEGRMLSSLLFAFGGDTISGRILAIYSEKPAFGGSWQPVIAKNKEIEPAVAGWTNSTPGRLLYFRGRSKKLTFPNYTKPGIEALLIPKKPEDIQIMDAAVRSCWDETMAQGRNSASCSVRAILDEAAAKILDIPAGEVHGWRRMLANEPTISGRMTELPPPPEN